MTTPNDGADSTTFSRSMGEAVHRWFRYSAGFSSVWAGEVIAEALTLRGGTLRVLDPFAGSGTTLLAAQAAGAESLGVESHPFVVRVAQAKLKWTSDIGAFEERVSKILLTTKPAPLPQEVPPLLTKCFTDDSLKELLGLLRAVRMTDNGTEADSLAWLAFVAIIRKSSHVGTAQWQYVLPKKSKSKVLAPLDAFRQQAELMASDMATLQFHDFDARAELLDDDARTCSKVLDEWADLVVTSPPYANNYDYADATRLEMTVLGEVSDWGDLKIVREHLIHSCSQHMIKFEIEEALTNPVLNPIRAELEPVVRELSLVKMHKGGKKAYDAMITAYFIDLANVWNSLRRVCKPEARACFVVGDSAPYGVYVPVERWLGELAVASGFGSWSFEQTRERNIKWKNRKHRVPLKEGRLWVDA